MCNCPKFFLRLTAIAMLLLAGCASSPDSRIAKNRELFEQWPQEVQERVAVGEVEPGYTSEQVRMALGDPDRVSKRTTAMDESEVWIYEKKRSPVGFSIGLGMGTRTGRNSSMGGGVSVGTGRARYGEAVRIVFVEGRVGSIEKSDR